MAGERFELELIAPVFNLFGADNLGGVGTQQVTNALSDPRPLAVRLVF